ncbi:hypothetical protein FQN50_008296 [Emmonsiellopsis sp. PD_5]|nr:hypothetical protein FQN50_008296 [Emmonsiellopsis sp. PD_5]
MADRSRDTTEPLQSSLKNLTINTNTSTNKKKPAPKKKKSSPVADSWEDESLSSASENEDNDDDITPPASATVKSPTTSSAGTNAPPPTPVSPQTGPFLPRWEDTNPNLPPSTASRSSAPDRRPEKQTAVANRMIAGALGIRAPKRTEEQRAYDRAVREKEAKRLEREREVERERKRAEEKAKEAVWEG